MTVDFAVLTLIMCVLEAVCIFGIRRFNQLWTVSVVTVMSLIMIMRWNWLGGVTAAIGGIVYAICSLQLGQGGDYLSAIVTYAVGNAAILLLLIPIKFLGKDRIKESTGLLVLYVLLGFLTVCLFRAIIGVFFGNNFFVLIVEQLRSEALNFVFALVVIIIANKQSQFFADQREYYNSLHEKQ